jgi:hypothetical protein
MAVKNIHITPRSTKDKPLIICDFGEGNTNLKNSDLKNQRFHLTEVEMKKIAGKMAKSLTNKKGIL